MLEKKNKTSLAVFSFRRAFEIGKSRTLREQGVGDGGLQGTTSDWETMITGTLRPQPLRPQGPPLPHRLVLLLLTKGNPTGLCRRDTRHQNTVDVPDEPTKSQGTPLPR